MLRDTVIPCLSLENCHLDWHCVAMFCTIRSKSLFSRIYLSYMIWQRVFSKKLSIQKAIKRLEDVTWNRKSDATWQRLRFHWVILRLQSKGQSMYRHHQHIVPFLVFLVCTRSCTAQNSLNTKVCLQHRVVSKYVVRVWKTSKKVWPEVLLKSLQQRLSWWGFKRM